MLDSQLLLVGRRGIFGLKLFYSLNKVRLLEASIAVLVPVAEDFLKIPNFELLQVDCVQINLLIYKEVSC